MSPPLPRIAQDGYEHFLPFLVSIKQFKTTGKEVKDTDTTPTDFSEKIIETCRIFEIAEDSCDNIFLNITLSDEVKAFIDRYSLDTAYQKMLSIAKDCFSFVKDINVNILVDPESLDKDEKTMVLSLYIKQSSEKAFGEWESFLSQFTENIPSNKQKYLALDLILL